MIIIWVLSICKGCDIQTEMPKQPWKGDSGLQGLWTAALTGQKNNNRKNIKENKQASILKVKVEESEFK